MSLLPRTLRVFTLGLSLWSGLPGLVLAQPLAPGAGIAPPPAAKVLPPKFLLKAGLRLTHLFYQPDYQSWQLVLPSSFGLEYRCNPRFSVYAQVEADVSASRGPRGRRGAASVPTSSSSLGLGVRYYFNQPGVGSTQPSQERWGNYLALESNAELAQLGRRGGRRGRGLSVGRATPAVFAYCGTQHAGPGQRLLYDLNAGLGIEAPAYATEPTAARPWNVTAQVNLRVYFVNSRRRPGKPVLAR